MGRVLVEYDVVADVICLVDDVIVVVVVGVDVDVEVAGVVDGVVGADVGVGFVVSSGWNAVVCLIVVGAGCISGKKKRPTSAKQVRLYCLWQRFFFKLTQIGSTLSVLDVFVLDVSVWL